MVYACRELDVIRGDSTEGGVSYPEHHKIGLQVNLGPPHGLLGDPRHRFDQPLTAVLHDRYPADQCAVLVLPALQACKSGLHLSGIQCHNDLRWWWWRRDTYPAHRGHKPAYSVTMGPHTREVTVPEHRVEIVQPPKQVINSDFTFFVYSDDVKLGELRISKGTVDWRPGRGKNIVRKSWEQFARLMED